MAGIVLPRVNRGEESAGEPRGLDMVFSSLGFIVGKAAAMGLGFVFWLIAARLASATAVGLTAGATSAIMLCGQFSLPGVGAALIGCYPDHRLRPQRLLDTVFTIGTVLGLVTGGAFLLLSTGLLEKLKVIASQPWFAAMFLAMSVFGTLGYVFDSVSMAQGRGDHVIVRNAANGLITIVPLILVPLFGIHPGSQALFGFWVFGAFTATVLALVQFGRAPGRYRYRPQADGQLVRRLMRTGLAVSGSSKGVDQIAGGLGRPVGFQGAEVPTGT